MPKLTANKEKRRREDDEDSEEEKFDKKKWIRVAHGRHKLKLQVGTVIDEMAVVPSVCVKPASFEQSVEFFRTRCDNDDFMECAAEAKRLVIAKFKAEFPGEALPNLQDVKRADYFFAIRRLAHYESIYKP